MIVHVILALIFGICAGIITGLVPGIHINLVSIILVSLSGYFLGFTSPVILGVFIIAMAVTHTFLDTIPSIFLGAPEAGTALSVLPGHKMLLEGRGYEAVKLTVVGSLVCLIFVIVLIPVLIPLIPFVYSFIGHYIGWILLFVSVFMILKERSLVKKVWGMLVFLLSGILGVIVLNMPNLKQPLFPLLSGLFGVSVLLLGLNNSVNIPEQKITDEVRVRKRNFIKAIAAATFSGSLTGMFPGLGAAQAAIIALQFVGRIGIYSFLILIGGINTVNFVFSLATFYSLEKARNGAIVALMEIVRTIDYNVVVLYLGVALVAGGIASFLALGITRVFSRVIGKINYKILSICVIIFIAVLVFYFNSFIGLFILGVAAAIGMIPALVNVKRSLAMGCLMLPVILFFLL